MNKRNFLFEIGCEELPSVPLNNAIAQTKKLFEAGLKEAGLEYGKVEVLSSPRRITVFVEALAEGTAEINQVMRGPSANIAFDADGNPTRAAEGFAKGRGLSAADLKVKDGYVYAEVHIPAQDARPLLVDLCQKTISDISWPRSQRWGRNHSKFVRPIRWMVCLFGDEALTVKYADVVSGTTTRGHRVLAPGEHEITCADEYVEVLHNNCVMLQDERRDKITEAIAKIEEERNGAHVDTPKKFFEEVVNLVEWPDVLVGKFDEEFLEVPHEIICESMLENQRYFPIYDAEGNLTREFVVVSNANPACAATVIDGNERVVRPRLADAKFFYEEDLAVDMEQFNEQLKTVVFQDKLGTVYNKVSRIEKLSELIADEAGLDADAKKRAVQAAHLCKADLVSQAVVEFTSQQGVMGGYYAKAAGYADEVATAIKEHYRPRFAGDELSSVVEGKVVACADKLDTICGIFAIDEPPTGSSDPYAVRRATIGVIAILKTMPTVKLESLVDKSLELYIADGLEFDVDTVKASIMKFFLGRLSAIAKDEGISSDTVEAVSATSISTPTQFFERAHALESARKDEPEVFESLATAYARANNLADAKLGIEVDESLMGAEELNLLGALTKCEKDVDSAMAEGNYALALRCLASLSQPIDLFFQEVMVMDKDEALRQNRLRLLNRFAKVFAGVANIGALAKKK